MRKAVSNISSTFRPALSENDEGVPLAMASEIVNDLRITFATYQKDGESHILLRTLPEIMQMMGAMKDGDPTPANLAEKAGIDLNDNGDEWETKVDFKSFVRFFIVLNLNNKTVEVKKKDIFRAMDRDDSGEITAEELGKLL